GPAELVFVAPERPSLLIHPEFEQMSHGAKSVESMLRVVSTTEEALADCTDSVGFTARVRGGRQREDWREVTPEFAALGDLPDRRLALVFGNEMTGMTAEESMLCQRLVHIPTSQEHTSLNLSVAVAVVLSSLFVAPRTHELEPGGFPVTGAEREFLKANLKWAMTEKVARSDQAKLDIAASIERVFSKSELETRDARAWHMMARALGSQKTPMDFGLDPNPKVQGERGSVP
ncbi:MAG: TrmH family RNA methyltransferase, partial [Planctomycetota bacterium]